MAHFFFVTFFSLLTAHISQAQSPCIMVNSETQKLTNNQYDNCNELPQFDSYILWSHDASDNRLSIAFSARPPTGDGWISWAINPTGDGMAGAQALVAFRASNGSMTVKIYNISSYSSITEGKLAFNVLETHADSLFGLMTIYATIKLPEKGKKSVNQVWQVGPSVSAGGFPAKHAFQPENLGAKGRLDLSGEENSSGPDFFNSDDDSDYGSRKRNIHGILNAVSWGILFPTGVIIARYLRTFPAADPTWFYLHAFCQVSAYAIGVAGWATGLKLGSESKGVTYSTHRNIGITLFSLATVQIFALFLRPNKDHKFRFYWNNYHHGIGYSILVLGILNVFKGLDILSPESKWRLAYIITISTLGAIALLLEVITWIVVFNRKSSKSTEPYDNNQQQLAP